nr:hypothetical protein [Escherichia coli]
MLITKPAYILVVTMKFKKSNIQKNKFIVLEISETYPELTQENDVIPFLCSLTEYIWLDDFW